MKHYSVFAITVCLVLCLRTTTKAQCDSNQTSQYLLERIGTSDSIPPSKQLPRFSFDMTYDSSAVQYEFMEATKNGNPLRLQGWCLSQEIKTLEEQQLSDSSRTEPFTVNTGDTIQFYREVHWGKLGSGEMSNTNYCALDTLDYAVELIRTSDNVRVVLVDSVGILRCPTFGTPHLYGTHNKIMAVVRYGVPSSFNGMSVRLRIQLYARGDGQYRFTRVDKFSSATIEGFQSSSMWQTINNGMSAIVFAKRSIKEIEQVLNAPGTKLTVTPNPSTTGSVKIMFSGSSPDKSLSVVVYDGSGQEVSRPVVRAATVYGQAMCIIDRPGIYFAALYQGLEMKTAIKFTIIKQ